MMRMTRGRGARAITLTAVLGPAPTVLAILGLLACGDDGHVASEETGTTGPSPTTLPLPTVGDSTAAEPTGTDTATAGADTETTGPSSDLPPPQLDDCERLTALLDALPQAEPVEQGSMIDGFIDEVGYGDHGFPITGTCDLAVVHVGEPDQALTVAGDFNGWDAGAEPLTEPVPGLGFYYAIVELPAPPQGLYKLVRDGTEYFADPLARRFGWDRFGEYSQIDPLADRSHHERYWGFDQGTTTLDPRTVTVFLPAGALDETALPVLYMHDGQNLFSPDALFGGWQVGPTLDAAITDGLLPPMVVVGIDNTVDRFYEYTPVTDVLGGQREGGGADVYADFVVDGVMPFVEARYPVRDDPEGVGTLGSSLGGLVSLYIGLRHPEVFGRIGSMSGTIDWGTLGASNPTIDQLYLQDPPLGLRIYVDSGGDPGTGCPDGDSDNYCGNVRMADTLRGLGWVDEVDLFYRWTDGAPHNEAAWADRLLPALIDWFPGG